MACTSDGDTPEAPTPDNSPCFDLTTPEGRNTVMDFLSKSAGAGMMMDSIFPLRVLVPLAKQGFDYLARKAGEAAAKPVANTIQAQRQAAGELIREGQRSGVKKMKITLDQDAGIDVGLDVEKLPVNVKFKIGKSGHAVIEVEYV